MKEKIHNITKKIHKNKNILILIMSLFLLSADIFTKYLINTNFKLMETKVIIVDFFSITKIYNEGASWNILSGYKYILIIIAIIMLITLYYYQRKFKLNDRNVIAFSAVYAGILGNLIDRIIYGSVIDFLDFHIFNYDFPVFNLADILIVFGIFLLIIAILKKEDINEFDSNKWRWKNR